MNHRLGMLAPAIALASLASPAAAQGAKPLTKCAPDAVVSGTVCMDKYEASVWRVPDALGSNAKLVRKIRQGKATVADLAKGGATQLGAPADDYAPCTDGGQSCADDVYAASLPGVMPSARITWFQAQVACENSGKRLPSNAEWQGAVVGTPNPGPDDGASDCNSGSIGFAALTGSRGGCVSARGAFDMVGNLFELVADWVPPSTTCGAWSALIDPMGDPACLAGAGTTGGPGVLIRGGDFGSGPGAGPFQVNGGIEPSVSDNTIGFRCAR
jgi:formylglycine-generating enzyme required for sulfatase activity